MIVLVEPIIQSIVSGMKPISVNSKEYTIQYYQGDKNEDREMWLNSIRQTGLSYYPLVWVIPKEVTGISSIHKTDLEIIIATKAELEGNIDKINTKYIPVLQPTTNALINAIKKSKSIISMDDDKATYKIETNRGGNGESEQSDIWDIIRIKIPITFNNC